MYIKTEKFIIDAIGTVSKSKNGLHDYLEIVLRKPAKHDEFNEATYPDDYFQTTAWNKKINELPEIEVGDKVEVMLNLQGRKLLDDKTGEYYFTKQLNIQKLSKL